ncbi:MAG TPA: MotA/TolQ/ExbB proton channel family protein [Armatimonadetes bacterium]|nr:MotA/TolQ/ExbB proton channel family protein [Armatimonadota bacterium]
MGTVLDFLLKGGPFMVPLLLCSIIMVAVILERLWTYRVVNRDNALLMREVSEALKRGNADDALRTCESVGGPVALVVATGLRRGNESRDEMREAMNFAMVTNQAFLERHLVWLITIANIAPLLGFLGTVSGLYKAFVEVTVYGLGDPTKFAAGVAEALITTVTGLAIAIPANIAYNYFVSRVDGFVLDMENAANQVLEWHEQLQVAKAGEQRAAAAS